MFNVAGVAARLVTLMAPSVPVDRLKTPGFPRLTVVWPV